MTPSTFSPTASFAPALVATTIAGLVALPAAATSGHAPPALATQVRLTATEVPPGGLLTSFVGNQVTYCSIICPLLVQTGVTAVATTAQAPLVFLSGLQSGDLLKAIGSAAASVTGPTNSAWAATVLADGSLVAPRAFNAFETAVVGVLDVVPAAANGLPGIASALQTARQNTFDALNAPIVPNPPSTVTPHGLVQVAVISSLNVVGATIFPALNDVLGAATAVPDAVARELAATGDPARAIAAGIKTAAAAVHAAVSVVTDAVRTGVSDIRRAVQSSARVSSTGASQPSSEVARTTAAVRSHPGRDVTEVHRVARDVAGRGHDPKDETSAKIGSATKDASSKPTSDRHAVGKPRHARHAAH